MGGSGDGLENVQFFDRVHTALPFRKQGFRKQGSGKELFSKHFGNMRGTLPTSD